MSRFTRTTERPRTGRLALASLVLCAAAVVAVISDDSASAEACDDLTIESVGLQRCVVDGGQREIDAGFVARVSGLSTPSLDWLAGHRTSHGATFARLTDLRVGATVAYRGVEYRVVEYRMIDRTQPWLIDDLLQAADPTVVLQTSAYGSFVHLWRATVVATPWESQQPDTDSTARIGDPTSVSIVAPTRILDTRQTAEPFAALQQRQVGIPVEAGVPATATVAFINLTAIGRDRGGHLSTYACGQPVPDTSSVNWSGPGAVGNLVVVPLAEGSFCGVASSTTDVVIDLVGYGDRSSHLGFEGALQTRLFDTRTASEGAMRGVETRRVNVARMVGDAAGEAVEVSLTARSSRPGHFTVHQCGADSEATSALNPQPGAWTTNSALVDLDEDGGFCVTSHFGANDDVDLFIDLHGSFAANGARFQRLKPVRLVDTRRVGPPLVQHVGTGGTTNARIEIPGSSWRGLPANDGLVVNVTTASATASGYVTAWPCATAKPNTSIQNPRQATATASASSIGDGGSICVQSLFPVRLVVDVLGAWVRS